MTKIERMLALHGSSYDKNTTIAEVKYLQTLLEPVETEMAQDLAQLLDLVYSLPEVEFKFAVAQAIAKLCGSVST